MQWNRSPIGAAALALASLVLATSTSGAQDEPVLTPVAAPAPPPAPTEVTIAPVPPGPPPIAEPARLNQLDDYTARTIGARRIKIGVLSFDWGITDWLSVGTDPPAWALRSVKDILIPNLHVKAAFLRTPRAALAAEIAAYFADISTAHASGELLLVPATLYLTAPVGRRTWIHVEGNYNWARGFGAGDAVGSQVRGALVARSAQVGAMVEVRLGRVVALLARGRYQPYTSDLVLEGGGMIDAYTNVEFALQARPAHEHPAMGIVAVACTWKYVGFVAGGGYGNYFIPGANLALPYTGFVPEGSLWVVF